MKHRWHAVTCPNIKGQFENQVWSINPRLKHLKISKLYGLSCKMTLPSAYRPNLRKSSHPDYSGASFTRISLLPHAYKHKDCSKQSARGSHLPLPAEQAELLIGTSECWLGPQPTHRKLRAALICSSCKSSCCWGGQECRDPTCGNGKRRAHNTWAAPTAPVQKHLLLAKVPQQPSCIFLNREGAAAVFDAFSFILNQYFGERLFVQLISLRKGLQWWQQVKWKLLLVQELCQSACAVMGELAEILIQSFNVQGVNSWRQIPWCFMVL